MDSVDQNLPDDDVDTVPSEKMSAPSVELSQTLVNINSSLGCMSDLLLKILDGTTPSSTKEIDNMPSRHAERDATGQDDMLSNGHDTLGGVPASNSLSSDAGTSRGKRPLGNAYSAKALKKLRLDKSDDEILSLHADEDEYEAPLSEAVADLFSVNDKTEPVPVGDSLLDQIAKALEISSKDAENINEKLAGIVNSRWGKVLPQEKLTSILEKYNRPGNCTTLFPVFG